MKQEKLSSKGYIFGLGAFRRYKETTGHDISHFEEALKPAFAIDTSGEFLRDENNQLIPVRSVDVDDVEAGYRMAIMFKCANDTHIAINGGEPSSIDEFENMLNMSSTDDRNQIIDQFLDSNYMGKRMRDYYGIPKPDEAKKKTSARVKRSPKP